MITRPQLAAGLAAILVAAAALAQDDSAAGTLDLQGNTVTLDFEAVDIRSLLGLLAEARQVNIVAGVDVEGTVSVNLYQVPFEQALDAVLGISGFTRYERGGIIFVTTEAAKGDLPMGTHDLDVRSYEIRHALPGDVLATINEFLSPSGTAVVSGEQAPDGGALNASVPARVVVRDTPGYQAQIAKLVAELDVPPHPAEVYELRYAEGEEILPVISGLLSPAGSAAVGPGGNLVVRDAPERLENVRQVLLQLDAAPRQIVVTVRMLNVTHQDDLSLGVEFTSSAIPLAGLAAATATNAGRDQTLVEIGNPSFPGIVTFIGRDHEEGFFEALSTRGDVETLATTDLLALDGEESSMIIGEKLGYKTNAQADNNTTFEDVQFLEVGTQLKVTPEITPDGLIRMRIAPKVSTGEINAITGVPNESTAELEANVLVREGQTIFIGGLLKNSKQRNRSQVPVLGDVPILGHLFRRSTWVDTKGEIVVLLTPRIVGSETAPETTVKIENLDDYDQRLTPKESDLKRIFGDGKPTRRGTRRGRT